MIILIPARDEAGALQSTLPAVRAAARPFDQIHVVADHCRDATAAVASDGGACVHVRSGPEPAGKGQAIRWWLDQTRRESTAEQVILILDADSLPGPGLTEALDRRMDGNAALQARVEPIVRTDSPLVRISAFSEFVEQRVSDQLRTLLGWPVRLRGTGMAFRRSILEKAADSLRTCAEDLELTLLLASWRVPILAIQEAVVFDPKPENASGAIRQRARWLKGQIQVLREYPSLILQLLASGPWAWSLLGSALIKPKTLLIPTKVIGIALFWTASAAIPSLRLLAVGCMVSLAFDFLVLAVGIYLASNRRFALGALLHMPSYFFLWVKSLLMAARSGEHWLRVRHALPRDALADSVAPD